MENQQSNPDFLGMTKKEALEAMQNGEKVTHRFFLREEWATIKNGVVVTEDGVCHPNFWAYKTAPSWERGWSKFQEN